MGSPLSFVIWMNSTVKSTECYRLKRTRCYSKYILQRGGGLDGEKPLPEMDPLSS